MNTGWKILIIIILATFTTQGWAQTNTFPSDGNVGIGTTSPDYKLHVNGDIAHDYSAYLYNGHWDGSGLRIYTYDSEGEDGEALLSAANRGGERFFVGGNGNVGIGTTSPSSLLHLLSPSADDGLRIGANDKTTEIRLHIAGGDYGFFNLGGDTHLRGNGRRSYFEGKLGIGTTNPDKKLTVNGTAKAEEVIVTENVGADFVFEEGYDLPELNEVEAHIKKHRHLPDIPSAEEMKRSGVKVGDLQMKLLQKIEELTLYTIEQQSLLEQQQKQIHLLKKQIKTLIKTQ